MSSIASQLYDCRVDMPGEEYFLYDLAVWKNGLSFKKIDFSENGVPVIRIAELNNGIGTSTAYSQGEYGDEVHLVRGDMLFSWSGNPQTSIDVFWFVLEEGWLNQHIFKVTARENIVYKEYLYYLMKSLKPVFTKIASNKQTTGLGHVTIADLKQIRVTIPSLDIQKQIVGIIKPIDGKINTNEAINRNLLEQAQAVFEEELLKFDCVPEDWKQGSLIDIADYLNGLAMQKFRPEDDEVGLPVLKIKELRQGFCDSSSELCSPNVKSDYIIHDGDVIFSWSGSLLVDFWCGGECGLNQHLFKVTSKNYDKWFYYAWTLYHLDRFIAVAADKATTMGHIKREELAKAEVLIPSRDDYVRIGEVLSPIYDMIISNRVANRKLAALRDELLPKLMSGELDVSELLILKE